MTLNTSFGAHWRSMVAVLLAVGLLPVPVLAQDIGVAGVTPDSPFWFFDVLFDNILLGLASTPEERAGIALDIANERLAEVDAAFSAGNMEALQLAEIERVRLLKEAEATISVAEALPTGPGNIEDRLKEHSEEAENVGKRVKSGISTDIPDAKKNFLRGVESGLGSERADVPEKAGRKTAADSEEKKEPEQKSRIEGTVSSRAIPDAPTEAPHKESGHSTENEVTGNGKATDVADIVSGIVGGAE
ncbi:MAG: hypothetical protein HYS81_01745 [Candidatus Aenigmatarchaeota archaeon]|nr:MAG: hypothetical protein HYS81_01745 [Candidatus Aenigmarchaeota archaeon]